METKEAKYRNCSIQVNIFRVSLELNKKFEKCKSPVLVLGILKGCIMFYSDFIKDLKFPVELSFITAKSYQQNKKQSKKVDINVLYPEQLTNKKDIILIDDICDSGDTLKEVTNLLKINYKPKSITSVVLINRNTSKRKFKPDYACFSHKGKEWFYGYGMDNNEVEANLPHIYIK